MLSLLPSEAIGNIADRISGYSLGWLWLTGDKALQQRLGSIGGVEHFELKLDNIFCRSWPNLIKNFPRLSHFSFLIGPYYHGNSLLTVDCSILPQTLRSIAVDEGFAATALVHFLQAHPGHFPHLESLKIGKTLLPEETPPLEGYPGLHTLFLEKVLTLDVASLPHSLTSLSFNAEDVILPAGVKFPPRLERLIFALDEYGYPETLLGSLPSTLKELVALSGPGWSGEELEQLPRHTRVNWGNIFSEFWVPRFASSHFSGSVAKLSDHFEGLKSGNPDASVKAIAGFTSLHTDDALTSDVAVLLPTTLTSLETSLALDLGHLLPRGLTILKLSTPIEVDLYALVSLPPGLHTLALVSDAPNRIKSFPLLTVEIANRLPRKLRSLTLQEISIEDPLVFEELGTTLEKLNLKCTTMPLLSMKHAPKSLRSVLLQVSNPLKGLCDSLLSTMPRRVSEIQYISGRGTLTNDGLKSLPPSLTSLIIQVPTSVTSQVTPFIPKDLKYARLDGLRPPWDAPAVTSESEYPPLLSM